MARKRTDDPQTIRNAESGQRVTAKVARAIAEALTTTLGRPVQVRDIDGLQVRM